MLDMGHWQSEITPETREANVKKIASHLEKFIPPEGVHSAVVKFSRNFEEHCWNTARSRHQYEGKIKDEMASIEKYDQLCEENPFTNRKYEGFLGAIRMTYNSKTVAAPPGQYRRDPDDITLEQSAKTVLRRNASLKDAVRKLMLAKAVKQGNSGSALFNAVKGLSVRKEDVQLRHAPTQQTTSAESSQDTETQRAYALNPVQKKNKNPGLLEHRTTV